VGQYGRRGFDDLTLPIPDNTLTDIREETNPRYFVGAEVTVPFTFRRERNNYRAAKSVRKQEELRLTQLRQNIIVEIDDAIKLAQSNFQRVDATRQARIFAEAALDAEQKKLENGKSTSFNVLQFQRDLTQALFNEIRALADYNQSLSQLHFSEGTILERNKINVEVKP
jgi:outer membrane protein TolC